MTTNAIPSLLPEDFELNIGNLDRVVNSPSDTFTDRLGAVKPTVAGLYKNSGLIVSNIAALRALVKTGPGHATAEGYTTKGDGGGGEFYYDASDTTSADNGGTVIVANDGGRWKRQYSGAVNALWFGVKKSGSYMSGSFGNIPTSPVDVTSSFQSAIDFCIQNGDSLFVPSGCYYFCNTSGLTINGTLDIIGEDWSKTQFAFNYTLRASPKTAVGIIITNNRGTLKNIQLRSSSYLGRAIQFSASGGDNQKFNLEKVWIDTHRYGLYLDEPECINQIEFKNCVVQSCYYWGVWFKSFVSVYGQSGPIHFINTVCNGNGPNAFSIGATYTSGPGPNVVIQDTANDIGGQLWMKGFGNVQFVGGQLSAHGTTRNQALAILQNINGFQFVGTDLEDIGEGKSYTSDGVTAITSANLDTIEASYSSDLSGGAVILENVPNFKIDNPHLYNLQTLSFLKALNTGCYNMSVGNFTPGNSLRYDVWDLNTNKDVPSHNWIHPSVLVDGNGVNAIAYENIGYKPRGEQLIHAEYAPVTGITPNTGTNVPHSVGMWQNGAMNSGADLNLGWNLAYLSNHNQPLTSSHLHNVVNVFQIGGSSGANPDELKFIYITAPYGQLSDGRFVIQAFDGSSNLLSSAWYSANNFSSQFPLGGTVRFNVPSGTKVIKYGFVNSANYNGAMKTQFLSNFNYSPKFFFRVAGIAKDIGRYGYMEPPYTVAKDSYKVGFRTAASQADSVAADVATLKADFNALLAKLRWTQVISQ